MLSGVFERTLKESDGTLRQFLQRSLRRADLLPDATQETYLRMLRYRGLTDPGEIRALLFRADAAMKVDLSKLP